MDGWEVIGYVSFADAFNLQIKTTQALDCDVLLIYAYHGL